MYMCCAPVHSGVEYMLRQGCAVSCDPGPLVGFKYMLQKGCAVSCDPALQCPAEEHSAWQFASHALQRALL